MNLGEFVAGKAQQPLPRSFQDHEAELDKFQKYCHNLMLKILDLFAIGLEVSCKFMSGKPIHWFQVDEGSGGRDWFSSRHRGAGPSGCTLRLLHYPPIPPGTDYQPTVDIRAGAHSDYGSITLLFQRPGQPGLEIIPPSTIKGERDYSSKAAWTPVPVFPSGTENDPSPPILVNIGDLLSYWTNTLLVSTVHRVVFPTQGEEGKDRYSIAYFGHPIGSTVLEPVPSEKVKALAGVEGGVGSGVKAMTADEHLMSRLKATYLGMYKDEDKQIVAA
jgi:isopenicillin N synthase-like dioxygenase